MGIKFSVVGEALKRILIDPALDDSGICQNLRVELVQEDLDERGIFKINTLSANELNNAIFHGWPENSGKKRRRLLMYSIQVCKENPDKELEL